MIEYCIECKKELKSIILASEAKGLTIRNLYTLFYCTNDVCSRSGLLSVYYEDEPSPTEEEKA